MKRCLPRAACTSTPQCSAGTPAPRTGRFIIVLPESRGATQKGKGAIMKRPVLRRRAVVRGPERTEQITTTHTRAHAHTRTHTISPGARKAAGISSVPGKRVRAVVALLLLLDRKRFSVHCAWRVPGIPSTTALTRFPGTKGKVRRQP